MSNYQVDWDRHNKRDKRQIAADIMSECMYLKLSPGSTAKIMFAAGHTINADRVRKFFVGRQKWLDNRKADKSNVVPISAADAVELAEQATLVAKQALAREAEAAA